LRSFLEMHNNFFEEIETAVQTFRKAFDLPAAESLSVAELQRLLEEKFGYTIIPEGLSAYPELKDIRSVFLPEKHELLLNGALTDMQLAFQLGKELGFEYLKLSERALTSSLLKINSFEEVLSHFKAGYFSAALLLDRQAIVEDLQWLFAQKTWDDQRFQQLLEKYQVTPETLMQRMTNLLPE
ncbi:MAG: DNA-binding protein, partial [Phaeodactylibacter sp.]|nr:DNA-binding protein [Phaeodactylibacter sp.]